MKTEDFDDAIKRKLESIIPMSSEKDIERVHQYTLKNRGTFSMLRSNRLLWPLMAVGMIVTGLVTWKLTSLYEHKAVVIYKIPNHKNAPMIPQEKQEKTIVKTDTVYITKYVTKYVYKHSANNSLKRNVLMDDRTGKIPGAEKVNPSNEPVTSSKSYATNIQNENNGLRGSITNDNIASSNNKDNPSRNNNIGSTPFKPNENNSQANLKASKNNDAIAEPKKTDSNSVKKAPIHDYSAKTKKKADQSPIHLSFMAGIGGEGANAQNGGGIYTKLTMNDRFSLNVGVQMMDVNNHSYSNDDAFDAATGYDFRWEYAPGLPPNCEIKNIEFTYSLLQLPLSLEYDLPCPFINNLYLAFSFGTILDLSCVGGLRYENTQGYGSETYQQQSATSNYSTVPFNNLFGSVCFIKKWHHFALELGPFASQQIKTAWYKGDNSTFYGGNIRVYYRF